MSEKMILTCRLPNNHEIRAQRTGVIVQARNVPDGKLFAHENEIWEALPGSNANLSNFDDGSEVVPWATVELLEIL